MPRLSVTSDWKFRGLDTLILENSFLRVVLLPQLGGKIWQITYKPLDTELLWNNPRIAPSRLSMNSRYDDVWCGGWDELFPNDEAAIIQGESYPDHGELWTGEWTAEPFEKADEVGAILRFTTPVSSISFTKTLRLPAGGSQLRFHHEIVNPGADPLPFLWKLHPAFAVSTKHRIDFPPMKVTLDPSFPGTLGAARDPFDWPFAQVGETRIDLRHVPNVTERQVYFLYGTEMKEGWCAVTNTETGLACAITFDQQVFASCWLFATYGGWRNYNVAVLEPCTGYPLNFAAMQAAHRARTLEPDSKLSTDVVFSVRENTRCVSRVLRDGTIIAA